MLNGVYSRLFSIGLIAIFSTQAYAFTHQTPLTDDWKLTIAPYAWATSMNGRVGCWFIYARTLCWF